MGIDQEEVEEQGVDQLLVDIEQLLKSKKHGKNESITLQELIIAVSIIIPLVVALLFRIRLEGAALYVFTSHLCWY